MRKKLVSHINSILLTATTGTLLNSCTLPDTPLWNDRDELESARMPMEVSTKVLLWGNIRSTINNPISGTRKGINMWRQRSRLLTHPLNTADCSTPSDSTNPSISSALDELGIAKAIPGKIDYFIGGKAFFDELYATVEKAQVSVDTQVFIFDNDDVAKQYSDLLKRKSKTVKCRVLMDQLGSISSWWTHPQSKMPASFTPPSSMPHYLEKKSKVRARESENPWLVADHTKLFVIDQSIAYIGGMNIGREYRYEWHDMMVKLEGPIAAALQMEFNKSWAYQSFLGDYYAPLYHRVKYRKVKQEGELDLRILKTDAKHKDIERAIASAIRLSKKRVYLENSYITSELIIHELIKARKRGVNVNLIYPINNDSKILGIANVMAARELIESRVNVYAYPKFSHIKAIVVDDWSCVGSANFDGLSMRINKELNISFEDKVKTQELVEKLFLKDIRASKKQKLSNLPKRQPKIIKSITGQL